MRIIALKGRHDSGKTTTLKKLANIFQIDNCYIKEVLDFSKRRKNNIVEIKVIFILDINGKTIKIAIFSECDRKKMITKHLQKIQELNCDICVCACLTDGITLEILEKIDEDIIYIDKQVISVKNKHDFEKQCEIANENDCKKLSEELEKMIKLFID